MAVEHALLEHRERELFEHPLLGRLDAFARFGRPLELARTSLLHRLDRRLGRGHERWPELHLPVDASDALRGRGLSRDELG